MKDKDKILYSQLTNSNVYETKKLRKGRVTLLITFIAFLVLDTFLIIEYKARGVNAIGYKFLEKVNNVLESSTSLVTSIWEPELNHTDNFTSVLLVGIDSRNVEFNGKEFINTKPEGQAGTRNTDTIIQVVYDHSNGKVFMISVPRDMGVDVRKDCLDFHGSIHWIYDKGQAANCPGGGVQTLTETVEGITGIKIHYYAFISLQAFIDVINAVGDVNEYGERGIWIDIEKPFYDLYPINDRGWEQVYIPAGHQFLNAEMTLKYVRCRQTSSDFGRAERQQTVIKILKERIISSETLTNPKKMYSLLSAFKKNMLFTEPNLEEIRAGISLAKDLDTSEITNIVLDPEFGGHEVYLNKQPHDRLTAQYYMVPTHWKECPQDEFCRVQEYIQKIIKYPEVFEENALIYVYATSYDSQGKPDLTNQKYKMLKENGLPINFNESKYITKISTENEITIYDFTDSLKTNTLDELSKQLGATIKPGEEGKSIRLNNEDIAIVVNSK